MEQGGGWKRGGGGGFTIQLCCGSVPASSHIAGAPAIDPQKPACGMCTAEQQARLEQVLKLVLNDEYDAAARKAWIQGPAVADAPVRSSKTRLQFLVCISLNHSFDEEAWAATKTTMDRLAHGT